MCTCSGSPPPTWAATALQIPLALPPHTSWPCATTTTPPSIDSKSIFFVVSPVKTGTHSKIFDFSCTGPAPTPPAHYAVAWGDYLGTFAHLCTPLCALSAPSMHLPHTLVLLFALHFLGLSPLSDFLLTLDPLLATMGNPTLAAPMQPICLPCGPAQPT